MLALRLFGRVFVVLALAVLVFGVYLWLAGHDITKLGGQLWFEMHGASLNMLQAVVQRYIAPGLWDVVIVDILLLPAWESLLGAVIIFLMLGGLMLWFAERLSHRRMFK